MRNHAGDLVMNIDATFSDNSALSAKLWRSSYLGARSAHTVTQPATRFLRRGSE
jgi:hypothetical protein